MSSIVVPVDAIRERILVVRGRRVLLDSDLARFYGVKTFNLNKAVGRNTARFPDDFSFRLDAAEARHLPFQFGISSEKRPNSERLMGRHGGRRNSPRVFTEQGVAMLASVLRSPRAVAVSVAIVRAFVRLRELLAENRELAAKMAELERKLASHDGAIHELFDAIQQLFTPPAPEEKRELGFHTRLLPPPGKAALK